MTRHDTGTSAALVKRIRQGDESAFEELFRAQCQPLVRFAFRLTRDLSTAENTGQEVFLKVWRDRLRLDPAANVRAYLYAAVRNGSLKHLRHLEVERRGAEELVGDANPVRTPEDERRARATAVSVRVVSYDELRVPIIETLDASGTRVADTVKAKVRGY